MGIELSKFFRTEQPKSAQKEKILVEDPRSPTGEINRTPIVIEKKYLETNLDDVLLEGVFHRAQPLRTRLLRSLLEDPRSPSIGFERTPILVDGSPVSSKPAQWESPISVYSSYLNESDSTVDMTAPPEPSVNVSDFENTHNSFLQDLDNLVDDAMNIDFDALLQLNEKEVNITQDEAEEPKLTVSDKPNTYAAQKLLKEICCESTTYPMGKQDKTVPKNAKQIEKKLAVYTEPGKPIRTRAPLSNITSSANSPSQLPLKGSIKKSKIQSESGAENMRNTKRINRQVAEWDHESTVII